MRAQFAEYYPLTDEEMDHLWNEGIFVLDTSVLLNLYEMRPEAREQFLRAFELIKARLWLPHHVASEFHKNRLDAVSQQRKSHAAPEFLTSLKQAVNQINNHPRRTTLDRERLAEVLTQASDEVSRIIEESATNLVSITGADPVLDRVTALFASTVGERYDQKSLAAKYSEIDTRYKQRVPPGYRDATKEAPARYGDAIIWYQMLDYATAEKKPVIFITSDEKEDWWRKLGSTTIGPRPELRQEMNERSGQLFYMYRAEEFLNHAKNRLQIPGVDDAIQDLREIEREIERAQEPGSIPRPPSLAEMKVGNAFILVQWVATWRNGKNLAYLVFRNEGTDTVILRELRIALQFVRDGDPVEEHTWVCEPSNGVLRPGDIKHILTDRDYNSRMLRDGLAEAEGITANYDVIAHIFDIARGKTIPRTLVFGDVMLDTVREPELGSVLADHLYNEDGTVGYLS